MQCDGAVELITDIKIKAGLLAEEAEDLLVAVLDGLHDTVPAAVHLVGVGAVLEEELEDLAVAAVSAEGLDDGEMLTRGVDVGTALVDEVPHDVLAVLADGGCERGEDSTVLVLDGNSGGNEELDGLELVGHNGHLHDTLEGTGLSKDGEDALKHRRVANGHAYGPVLATNIGPGQCLNVVNTDSSLDNTLGGRKVCTSFNQGREELEAVVCDTLEGWVLAGGDVGVSLVGEEEVEDVGSVVTNGCAEGGVDTVLLKVGVNLGVEEHLDGLNVVDTDSKLHDTRGLLWVGAVGKENLQASALVGSRPKHVLGTRQVRVCAMFEKTGDDIDTRVLDSLEQRGLSLATLAIGISAVVEDEVDELLGRLLVDGAAEEGLTGSGKLVGVAAVDEEEVGEVDLVGDAGGSKGSLVVGAKGEAGISTVFEEGNGTGDESPLDGGEERCDTISIVAVGMIRASVGRHATVQELLNELVVLAANGSYEGSLEVGCISTDGVSGVPSGHAEGIGLDSNNLGSAIEVKAGELFERDFTI
ncbi:hypothetical protein HG530_008188 [Fusarium avenaceum]|nr:hypothetical protein HG530_008188 [Fusarium avenaceum]